VRECFLRREGGAGPQAGTAYSVRREAAIYRALEDRGVAVPRVLAVHPSEEAFLSERVGGESLFPALRDPAVRERVADRFMVELARLHSIDVRELSLSELGDPVSVSRHIEQELDVWETMDQGRSEPEPLIDLTFAWLRRNLPRDEGPPVLVHGDAGPGNFLFDGDRVSAVLDWELAHLGDPMEDLGWVCVRDLIQPFGDLRQRFVAYEKAGGQVDLARVRYFRILAQAKCVIGTLRGLEDPEASAEIAGLLMFAAMHRRVLVEGLAREMGVGLTGGAVDAPETGPHSALYDVALAELRDVVAPACEAEFARHRAKGVARLLKYLKEVDRAGSRAVHRELDDLASLLGERPSTPAAGRRQLSERIRAGEPLDQTELLRTLHRRVSDETALMAPSMGALASRHYAKIDPD
jgi:aminoglycoside phosphotransferase (APT) family kinase protein